MLLKQLSETLYPQMMAQVEETSCRVKDPLERLAAILKVIRGALEQLKGFIEQNPFESEADEICFFKQIKPLFYQWQLYYTELYTIESGATYNDADKLIVKLEEELLYVERCFRQHAFHYQYYKLRATELDSLYFVRDIQVQSILLPDVPELHPAFATSSGYLFAKFMAFEELKGWLTDKIARLKRHPENTWEVMNDKEAGEMYWTGDPINLGEVAHGIHLTGQLNNGTAGIGEIFRWLESKLHVTLGKPAKKFAQIKGRKRLARTKYLDEMKEQIGRKSDKEDEYVPEPVKKIRRDLPED
jgi:hypothetical protein